MDARDAAIIELGHHDLACFVGNISRNFPITVEQNATAALDVEKINAFSCQNCLYRNIDK